MHRKLHNAEAQPGYLFHHEFEPARWFGARRLEQRCVHDEVELKHNLYYVNRDYKELFIIFD